MRAQILGWIAVTVYRLLVLTWRVRLYEPDSLKAKLKDRKSFTIGHWHGDELAILFLLRRYNVVTMISQSMDGSIMARAAQALGAEVVRGSSSRGSSAALKALLRASRKGRRPSLAVDGPKGPLHQVKPGVFEISRVLSLPIYALSATCDRAWRFEKSWNKTFLPKPFAKVSVYWSGPLAPISKENDPRAPEHAKRLEEMLFDAKQQATMHLEDGSSKMLT